MRVFVLCTGRCGSTTFAKACEHMTNFTSGHETNMTRRLETRFDYPDRHIEVDNRLIWYPAHMDQHFGDEAYYVHLTRERESTATSCARRYGRRQSILTAYVHGIRSVWSTELPPKVIENAALDYYDMHNANIRYYLSDRKNTMTFAIESAGEDFVKFWNWIGAEGDLQAALTEFDVSHNSTEEESQRKSVVKTEPQKTGFMNKVKSILRNT